MDIKIRQHWFRNCILINIAAALLVTISLWFIPRTVDAACNILPGGIDGLACQIFGVVGALLIISVAICIVVIKLMQRFVYQDRLVVILSIIPAIVFVLATITHSGLTDLEPSFPNSLQDHALVFLIGSLTFSVITLIGLQLFRWAARMSIVISILICLALCFVIFLGTSVAISSYRTAHYVRQQHNAIEHIGFQVYQPTFIAPDFVQQPGWNGPSLVLGSFVSGDNNSTFYEPTHYQYSYYWHPADKPDPIFVNGVLASHPNDYSVYEYKATAGYNPPYDCGNTVDKIESGGSGLYANVNKSKPCAVIGQSTMGCDVYFEQHTISLKDTYLPETIAQHGYCKLGSTIITVTTETTPEDNEAPGIEKADMIKLFDSLQLLTTKQLKDYVLPENAPTS